MRTGPFAENTIKSRLFLLSSVIILLLISSLFSTFFQTQRVIARYSLMANYQLLLSGIYLRIAETSDILQDYLESGKSEDLATYNRINPLLLEDALAYSEIDRSKTQKRVAVDFRYMVQTYVEETNRAVSQHQEGDLENSTWTYLEARRVQSLITRYLPEIVAVQNADVARINAEAKSAQKRSLIINLVLFTFVASFSIVLTRRISGSITRPVAKLVRAAGAVSRGIWETRVEPIVDSNEMKLTGDAFNEMLEMIHHQMIEINESRENEKRALKLEIDAHKTESLLKEAQLKTLQARINPHFLFNTLNMITQSAYLEGSRKTAEITEAFASLMRFNLEHFDGVVSLQDEFANLEDYLFLQRMRHDGRVEMNCQLDTDLLSEKIPGLVLQPLVENSIVHGMGEILERGYVRVRTVSQGDHYMIIIEDNGIGMTPDSLKKARGFATGVFPGEYGEHIGIQNVLERLYLYFDRNVEIDIESSRGEGTTIRLILPRGAEL